MLGAVVASSREQSGFSSAPPGLVLSRHSFLFSPILCHSFPRFPYQSQGAGRTRQVPIPPSRRLLCGILRLDLWAKLEALVDMVPGFSLAFNGMNGFRAARGERGAWGPKVQPAAWYSPGHCPLRNHSKGTGQGRVPQPTLPSHKDTVRRPPLSGVGAERRQKATVK